jgi:hypothetical protein
MRSDSLEPIFRRDLDQLPTLSDDEWVPAEAGSRRTSASGLLAVCGLTLAAIVVALSVRAVREAEAPYEDGTSTGPISSSRVTVSPLRRRQTC